MTGSIKKAQVYVSSDDEQTAGFYAVQIVRFTGGKVFVCQSGAVSQEIVLSRLGIQELLVDCE